jgi:Methyltransferase domain
VRKLSENTQQFAKMREERDAALARVRQWERMLASGQVIGLDYPASPKARYGHGAPVHAALNRLLAKGDDVYRRHIEALLKFLDDFRRIAARPSAPSEPHWINDWIPAFDAAAIYGFLALRNPRTYVEIGSGMSTKFARAAIKDHGLRTRILSIDPKPRGEIDALCDEIIRQRLQDMDLARLAFLSQDDMLFFDGSHYCLQNSDATVFFTEILPSLAKGIFVGVHDIFLPHDYPRNWLARHYSEQYLLACYLLGGEALRVELPAYYCSSRPELHDLLKPLWESANLKGAEHAGGAFWFTTNGFPG